MSETQAAQLSKLFASAGWTRSTQNFEPRPFVVWHGNFYTVAGSPPGMGSHSKACRTEAEVLAFLAGIVAPEQALPEPEPEPIPEPVLEAPVEAVEAPPEPPAPDTRDEQIAALQARIAELETVPTPPLPYPDEEPYVPNFALIPDALAKYAEADETAEDFRKRAFSILFRFGIAEGENFEGGGEPLTADEKIKLLPMLIANFSAGNWLGLSESLKPD